MKPNRKPDSLSLSARDIREIRKLIQAKQETLSIIDKIDRKPVSLDMLICELALIGLESDSILD